MRTLISSLALAAVFAAPVALHADPLTGQFSIQGSVINNLPSSTGQMSLGFVDLTIVSGNFTQTGSFTTVLPDGTHLALGGMPAPTLSNVNGVITPVSTVPYNPYTSGFLDFQFTSGLSADVLTLVGTPGTGTTFDFAGTALLSAPGFDPTPATFDFSTQGPLGTSVTLSATADASPVPEPSALLLFGTGALGLAGIVSKKFIA